MKFGQKHRKLLSLFVIAFLCLNVGGMLCLAYCATPVKADAAHCPLKKKASEHCNRSNNGQTSENIAFKVSSVTCCSMPVSIFAAPLEQKSDTSIEFAIVAATTNETVVFVSPLVRSRQIPKYYYRPPPNDLRFERVRNQVFRI